MDKKSVVLLIIASIVFIIALVFAIWSFGLDLNIAKEQKSNIEEIINNEGGLLEQSKTKDFEAKYTDFEAKDVKGKKIRLSDYSGTPVVVLFFSEKNNDSMEMLSKINEQYDLYKKTIKFICINTDEESDYNFKKLKVPVAYDKNGEIKKSYEVTELPTILYIDKYNEVFNAKTGLSTTDALKANLDILAENY